MRVVVVYVPFLLTIGLTFVAAVIGIATLLVPGVVLPALACFATGALAAWATLGFVALALVVLDMFGLWMGRTGSPAPVSSAPAPAPAPALAPVPSAPAQPV